MNIIENYAYQDLRNIELGRKHQGQPRMSLQLCNASSQPIKLLLLNKGDGEWVKKEGPGTLHLSNDGLIYNLARVPYVDLNVKEWILLDLPSSPGAFVIYARSLCDGNNCLSGAVPSVQTGFYKPSGDWQRQWPNGGGYTICDLAHGCDNSQPSAGATKVEAGKDAVADISMVDGYNHSVKMEVSTEINDGVEVRKRDVTIVANPQDCKYGVRNYAADTSKGMIGCSNTFKDGNQRTQVPASRWNGGNKPRYPDLTPEGQSGFCNFMQIPWNGCQRPCDPASDPDSGNWQGPCFAPSMEYCKTIHNDNYPNGAPYYYGDKKSGKFTTYCFSHDDDNSSPELKDDDLGRGYRLKLTFGDGIVGKPFNSEGCNWSTGNCENPNPPANTAWYCTPENTCSELVQREHDPGYPTKEECVRNSNCRNYAKNFYCENNVCTFHDSDNLQTFNECRSACGGRSADCKEGCDPGANPRAMCKSGIYCPANGCCDDVNPVPPSPPPAERYDCVNGRCVMNFLGTYPTRQQCESGCGGNQPCQGNLCDPHSVPSQRCPNGTICPITGCCPR